MPAVDVGSWTPTGSTSNTMSGVFPFYGPVQSGSYLLAVADGDWVYSSDEGQTWTKGIAGSDQSDGHFHLVSGIPRRVVSDGTQYVVQIANAVPPTSLSVNAGLGAANYADTITGGSETGAILCTRSTGEQVIFQSGPAAAVMGGDWQTVGYTRRSTGGTVTNYVQVSVSDDLHFRCPNAVAVGNNVHFFYSYDDSTLGREVTKTKTLSSTNVLSSEGSWHNGIGTPSTGSRMLVVGTTLYQAAFMENFGAAMHIADASGTGPLTITSTEDVNFTASVNGDGGQFLAYDAVTGEFYYMIDTFGNGIYFRKRTTGGVWGSETLYDNNNSPDRKICGVEVLTKANGSRVLAAVLVEVDASPVYHYTEYEIAAASGSFGSGSGTVTWTGTAESAAQNGSGSGTVSWTGTAIQGKSGSVVSPGWGVVAAPTGVTDFVVADSQGRMYSVMPVEFGGVQRFDPTTDEWTSLAALTSTQWSDYALAVDGQDRIYVLGGYEDGSAGTPLATATRYDPDTDTWSALPDMPVASQSATGATDLSGRVYVLGGLVDLPPSTDTHVLATVLRFDPGANSWSQLTDMPVARAEVASATDDLGRIYAIGGEIINDAEGQEHTTGVSYRFDPGTGNWTSIASIPNEAAAAAGFTDTDGTICVLGGLTGNGVLGFVDLTDFYRFDPDTGAWTTDTSLPVAMTPAGAGIDSSGRIMVVNGSTQTYRFAPFGAVWSGTSTGTNVVPMGGGATASASWSATASGNMVEYSDWSAVVSATTLSPIPEGSATGATSWTGTADGELPAEGSGVAAASWAAAADGEATTQGSAAGAGSWTGVATGAAAYQGDAATSASWTGTGTGTAPVLGTNDGAAAGTAVWTAATEGTILLQGSAAGTFTTTGTATGRAEHNGAASSTAAWAATTDGSAALGGSATGSATWGATTSGGQLTAGSGVVTYAWSTASTGTRVPTGTTTSTFLLTGTSSGGQSLQGSALGTFLWVGRASQQDRDITIVSFSQPYLIYVGAEAELAELVGTDPTTSYEGTAAALSDLTGVAPDNEWDGEAPETLWVTTAPEL